MKTSTEIVETTDRLTTLLAEQAACIERILTILNKE